MARNNLIVTAIYVVVGLATVALGAFPLWSAIALWSGSPTTFVLTLGAIALVHTQRVRHPMLALTLGAGVAGLDILFGGSVGVALLVTDLIYGAVNRATETGLRRLVQIFIGLVSVVAVMLVVTAPVSFAYLGFTFTWLLAIIGSGAWGWNVRTERQRTQTRVSAQHTDEFLARQRELAHDLHDLVANQIAVAGLHIEAARLLSEAEAADPSRVRESLAHAKSGTDAAHRELRALIGVLTASPQAAHAGPDVEAAVANLKQLLPGGRRLKWSANSNHTLLRYLQAGGADLREIPIRVLTELIANAVKHGRGDVGLEVSSGAAGLKVTVTNTTATSPAPPGTAIGLTGARHLLTRAGGHLVTTPADPGTTWSSAMIIPAATKEEIDA